MKVKKENYLMLPYSAQAFALNIGLHKNRSKKLCQHRQKFMYGIKKIIQKLIQFYDNYLIKWNNVLYIFRDTV